GVDEVYALSVIADALFEDRYERVIVDPAPTGHLLRLLEMPKLSLAWCHQLLRLMLKYKEVAGLGESAAEILEFSKSLRAMDALLHDAERAGVVMVTVDEPVIVDETSRLSAAVGQLGIPISAVIVNRAGPAPALPTPQAAVQLHAPLAQQPPVGVAELRQWARGWQRVPPPTTAS
ncbi:MAG TPA: ArsA-related P-loop ATPase, partial [Gemmatimonadaceae bacterium]|nr:ArsA-related P-loop ATPase [Gemmatimonadaceae bacterium]